MSIVTAFPKSLNSHVVTAESIGVTRRAIGHADEATAMLAEPEPTPEEINAGVAEWEADQAIQAADERHAAEMRAGIREAKERFGASIGVQFNRDLKVDSDTGVGSGFALIIFPRDGTEPVFAVGVSPLAALDAATANIDRLRLSDCFGGYRVKGRATILAGHGRTREESKAMARRIAVDPSYLSVAVQYNMPGIIDERTTPPVTSAAVASNTAA